jgi:hypothetical protein
MFPDFRNWLLPKIGLGRFASTQEYEERILLGEWCVRSDKDNKYIAIWEFCPNGTVKHDCGGTITQGRWHFEKNCVSVVWEAKQNTGENCWDNLNRPIRPYTTGDNWVSHNCVIARKLPKS